MESMIYRGKTGQFLYHIEDSLERRQFLKAGSSLFFRPEFCNVKVKTRDECGNEVVLFACSRYLGSSCGFLKEMYDIDHETEKREIEIYGFRPKVVYEMLRFIHCRYTEDFDNISRELIYLAVKYGNRMLKFSCVWNIYDSITVETVLKDLIIAHDIKEQKIFRKCIKMIIANFDLLRETKEWKDFPKHFLLWKNGLFKANSLFGHCLNTISRNYDAVSESQDWNNLPDFFVKNLLFMIMKSNYKRSLEA